MQKIIKLYKRILRNFFFLNIVNDKIYQVVVVKKITNAIESLTLTSDRVAHTHSRFLTGKNKVKDL